MFWFPSDGLSAVSLREIIMQVSCRRRHEGRGFRNRILFPRAERKILIRSGCVFIFRMLQGACYLRMRMERGNGHRAFRAVRVPECAWASGMRHARDGSLAAADSVRVGQMCPCTEYPVICLASPQTQCSVSGTVSPAPSPRQAAAPVRATDQSGSAACSKRKGGLPAALRFREGLIRPSWKSFSSWASPPPEARPAALPSRESHRTCWRPSSGGCARHRPCPSTALGGNSPRR